MINADVEGMKRHADAMNVGHVFGLFACMLSARSWKALQAGIGKYEFSEAEVGVLFLLLLYYLQGLRWFGPKCLRQQIQEKSGWGFKPESGQ